MVSAIALDEESEEDLKTLGPYGADRILQVAPLVPTFPPSPGGRGQGEGEQTNPIRGDHDSRLLAQFAREDQPSLILASHSQESADLCPRLAALLHSPLVSRAMDLWLEQGDVCAIRPVSNGYLFEEVLLKGEGPPLISFLPSVLSAEYPDLNRHPQILTWVPQDSANPFGLEMTGVHEDGAEALDLEEADIVLCAGRGVGKGESFQSIHELAALLGAVVGGSRPVIDWQLLPFERQIGQTGKTVAPKLMMVCGVSGANEFTAGMEKSQRVIAINKDIRAKIFRLADLGVVGDVHEILPRLVARIKGMKETL